MNSHRKRVRDLLDRAGDSHWLDRWGAGVAALFVVVGVLVRLSRINQSLWFDEVFRTRVVLRPERIGSLLWHDVHNPLYNALMYGWVNVFGDREWVIRLPGVLAGVALVIVVFAWVRERWGATAAWWAAAWLWLTPAHAWYSCEAKNNIVTVLVTTLSLWGLDRACERRTIVSVGLAALTGALALWTDFQSLLVLPVAWGAWALWGKGVSPDRRAWMIPVMCAVGTLVLASPLLVHKAAHAADLKRDYLRYFGVIEIVRLVLVYFPTGNALVPAGTRTWPLAALAMAPMVLPALARGVRALVSSARGPAGAAGRVVLASLVAPVCAMIVGSEVLVASGSAARIYQERNVLVMLPLLAIVLGVGAARLKTRRWQVLSAWGLLAAALVSSVGLATWSTDRDTLMYPNPDWRGACAHIRSGGGPTLVISRTPLLPVQYYLPSAPRVVMRREEPPAQAIRTAMGNANTREAWLIVNPNWHPVGEAELAEIEREFRVIERREFRRLSVLRLGR